MGEENDSAKRIEVALSKYKKSPKGRNAQKKYENTEAGKETLKRYRRSDGAKLSQAKWYHSPKGKDNLKKRNEKRRQFAGIEKWLVANPGKTVEDAMKELGYGSN